MTKSTKSCTVCKTELDLSLFYNRKASEDGKAYRCKSCDDKAVRKFREKHRERYLKNARKATLKYKYGLSEQDFDDMLSSQGFKCAICRIGVERTETNKHTKKTLVVDHCHDTGVVRGILCSKCNRGLGHFDDQIELLEQAINYIKEANG